MRHDLKPVEMGRTAKLEQDVEPVVGDAPCDIPLRQVRHPAEFRDLTGDVALHLIGFAWVEGIGEQFEPIAVVMVEDRQREIAHRMMPQVGRYDADANARSPAARGA